MCSMCKAARSELRQGGPCVQCVLCVRLLGRCCAREAHVIHVAAEWGPPWWPNRHGNLMSVFERWKYYKTYARLALSCRFSHPPAAANTPPSSCRPLSLRGSFLEDPRRRMTAVAAAVS